MNFEIKDLTGMGQPLTKLIEVISAGIGVIYRPRAIRKEAEAKAYAAKVIGNAENTIEAEKTVMLANSQAKGNMILANAGMTIEERAKQRNIYQESQRQKNLEEIAAAAEEQIAIEVSDEPVDPDWRTRFFNIAQDVSSSEMQKLWGKILAGEVANPGTYSLRALEIMKNLSQKEAQIFQRARYLSTDRGNILKIRNENALDDYGLSYDDILILREAGLMLDGDMIIMQFTLSPERDFFVLAYNGMGLLIEPKNKEKFLKFDQFLLSSVGIELLSLIEPEPHNSYLEALAKQMSSKSCELSIGKLGAPKTSFRILN